MNVHASEKKAANRVAKAIRKDLERLGAVRNGIDASSIEAMKPEVREKPFNQKDWVFELKYDGFRMLAERAADAEVAARLLYRSGKDATRIFPEIAQEVAALPFALVLDGEAVTLDGQGRPDFQRLQRRGQRNRATDAGRAAVDSPAVLFVFDLLAFEGYDLRPLPLAVRKAMLRRVLPPQGSLRYVEEVPERGVDLYAAVEKMGLEGIVAKRTDSPYQPGYSPLWLKIRVDRTCDFAVVGFEPGPGGFRCLHLAVCQGPELVYAGTVGSGFSREELKEIHARMEPARRPKPAFSNAPAVRGVVWVEPELVVEVRYKEWTRGGSLRHPVFLRLRDDKKVSECSRPDDAPGEPEETEEKIAIEERPDETRKPARFTRLDKVFWPDEGYTKGDLIEYYRSIAEWILPYLRDRPLVLDRYPDGIAGKSFFQKNAADMPGMRTVAIGQIEYVLCDDVEGLTALANSGAIPLHVWASRLPDLDRPDWCILDLDPKGAPFRDVIRIALAIGDLCDEIELPCRIKTSGGSGLHLLIPLGRQCDHDQSRQLAELLARVVVDRLPAIATTARTIAARRGKVYVDALQNGRGKLLAGPFSVRPRPGATVSTPLAWSEVGPRLDVRDFHIQSVPRRMEILGEDPLRPVLELRPDLLSALTRLSGLV
jgi:bifunctional non-homologous end joining protein LigD